MPDHSDTVVVTGGGPPRERDLARARTLIDRTIVGYEEAVAVDGGYALGYPNTRAWRSRLQEFAAVLGKRLLALDVDLQDEGRDGRIWLHLTGPPKVQEYIEQAFILGQRNAITIGRRRSLAGRGTKRAGLFLRRVTSAVRVSPDFVIIGAARGGTTSLYSYLTQHPSIVPALRKEVYFFDHAFEKGMGYYRSYFPTRGEKRRTERRVATGFRTGEATPCYLFHPHVPRRMAEHLPHARLIAVLRNPVDRAYSEYCQKFRMGYEDKLFEEAIECESQRVEGELEKMLADEHYFSHNRWHFSYLGRGCYADQLQNWFDCFPRDQVLVLASEDVFRSPAESYARIMAHLDLPAWAPERTPPSNTVPYPEMSGAIRKRLVDELAPHNRRLYEMLGETFDWDR